MSNSGSTATHIRTYSWASPKLKWFNFIPFKFKNLKQKQKQALVDEIESAGHKILEYCDTPFLAAVKLSDTGFEPIK